MRSVVPALALIWLLLSGGELGSWIIGAPAVAAASWAAHRLRSASSRGSISLAGVARFVPVFLWQSLRGGVDVAWRTLAPTMRVRPGFSRYQTSLSEPSARVFFASCLNLLPGTLTATLDGDRLRIHQLDIAVDATADLRRLERAVARVFGARAAKKGHPA